MACSGMSTPEEQDDQALTPDDIDLLSQVFKQTLREEGTRNPPSPQLCDRVMQITREVPQDDPAQPPALDPNGSRQ